MKPQRPAWGGSCRSFSQDVKWLKQLLPYAQADLQHICFPVLAVLVFNITQGLRFPGCGSCATNLRYATQNREKEMESRIGCLFLINLKNQIYLLSSRELFMPTPCIIQEESPASLVVTRIVGLRGTSADLLITLSCVLQPQVGGKGWIQRTWTSWRGGTV